MVPSHLELRRQPVTFTVVMANPIVNLKHTVAALGFWVLLGGVVFAQNSMPAADELLDRLRMASPAEAGRIEREVQMAWSRSGSATMDLLYARGNDAMRDGNTKLAIEHFTALTDHAPEFAADLYRKVLAINPHHENAQRALDGLRRDGVGRTL